MICDLFSGFFALEGIWCVFAFRLSAFVEVTIWKVCVVRFNDEMIYDHDQDSYDKKSHLAPGHFRVMMIYDHDQDCYAKKSPRPSAFSFSR